AALTGPKVLPNALARIASNAMQLAHADGAYIEQSNEEREHVDVSAAVGTCASRAGKQLPFNESVTASLIHSGAKELNLHSLDGGKLRDNDGKEELQPGGVAVPLQDQGNVVGALVVVHKTSRQHSAETEMRLQTLGAWAAL